MLCSFVASLKQVHCQRKRDLKNQKYKGNCQHILKKRPVLGIYLTFSLTFGNIGILASSHQHVNLSQLICFLDKTRLKFKYKIFNRDFQKVLKVIPLVTFLIAYILEWFLYLKIASRRGWEILEACGQYPFNFKIVTVLQN